MRAEDRLVAFVAYTAVSDDQRDGDVGPAMARSFPDGRYSKKDGGFVNEVNREGTR
jgi:hypothetical protein